MKKPEKKLGFGFMRLPLLDAKDQTSIDVAQVEQMVDLFLVPRTRIHILRYGVDVS